MAKGIAVVIKPSGGLPVRNVASGKPLMTEVETGKPGIAITLSARGVPFVVQELP
jgi:hypothetical protein